MEGFGLPVVEAMVSKCLVLASDIPSLREICQEAAIYFNPTDVNDVVKHLQMIVDKPELKNKLTEKGFTRGLNFSWEKSAKETLKVYESCLSL
jgi:glycosyltransferase involved in cell wall biosynthesis